MRIDEIIKRISASIDNAAAKARRFVSDALASVRAFFRIAVVPYLPRVKGGSSPLMTALDIALGALTLAACAYFIVSLSAPDKRMNVTIEADGHTVNARLLDTYTDIEALEALDIDTKDNDTVNSIKEEGELHISLERAYPVAVRTMDTTKVLSLTGGTVGDALRLAGAVYDGDDELTYPVYADTFPGMKVVLTAVETEYTTSYKTLRYKEESVYDESKYNDSTPELLQTGSDGLKQVTERLIRKDGVEVSHEVVDQLIVTPAVNEIIKYGSRIHYQTSYEGEYRLYKKAPKAGVDGWVEMTVDYATAYCTGTRTATGTKPRLGTIAVNTYYIPYGTEIYIPHYGYGVARDTGAFRNYKRDDGSPVNQVDLWFNTKSEASRWGRKRNMTILVRLG